MKKWTALPLMILAAGPVGSATAQSSQNPVSRTLTAQDRTELESLGARYSWALATCDVEKWPAVFTPDGWRFKSHTYRPS